MASSSNSHKTLKNSKNVEEIRVSKVGQDEEDWLDLGLGLGLGTTTCRKIRGCGSNLVSDSPSSSTSRLQMPINFDKLELGLGLGFERSSGLGPNKKGSGDVVDMEPPDGSENDNHNRLLGRSDHCYNRQNIHSGMGLLPSWQMGSHQEWDMVVPSVSHHDLARKTHEAGLWFTLRSSTNQ